MTNEQLNKFVSEGFKNGGDFEKKVTSVYLEVFSMNSPCSGCADKHLKMFAAIKKEVQKRNHLKNMGKSNLKYSFNQEFKGVTTFVKIGENAQLVASTEKDQTILKALHEKKPHLVIVDGEAEPEKETTKDLLKKAKQLKVVAYTKSEGYSFAGENFGATEAEAVAFLEDAANEDNLSVIKEAVTEAEAK